ncbi:RadC family protein [Roseomonas xinghualingensis]|uniref:RadC family protein n=1 Tax=Roseomonas xinghualingensis TaxID=2986475 RepID=UPI0021F21C07|nr:DNA repair protein RadC [Roseomonas sp. SXEYE001]MCV4209043.1 DNA repair protein RadC [Roseomonas sp. SXEYE001]
MSQKLFRRSHPAADFPDAPPRAAREGFAESMGAEEFTHAPGFLRSGGSGHRGWSPSGFSRAGDAAFASTGPHGHRGRMRQKLLERGPDALADYELLEMLLFFAFKKGDTKPLAKSLINRHGSFAAVLAAPQAELLATHGLGEHSVAALKLVQASALRLAQAEAMEQPILNNWDRLLAYLNAAISREKIEQFRILFLDSKNRLIADEAQAKGTVNHTPVYPREVIKRALELHATALILVHNHPSGDPTPSRADIEMTQEIRVAGEIFSIVVHDHLIIGNGRHLSFRREGLL